VIQLGRMRDIKYRWILRDTEPGTRRDLLYDVGILADGTLHNPHGYPEDVVRSAVSAAIERGKKDRSDAAKKAAVTRGVRMERKVYEVVRQLGLGHKYGPSASCCICGKLLDDPQSIERGIGSNCWQRVMKAMTHQNLVQ
jgi:hypothetical protein